MKIEEYTLYFIVTLLIIAILFAQIYFDIFKLYFSYTVFLNLIFTVTKFCVVPILAFFTRNFNMYTKFISEIETKQSQNLLAMSKPHDFSQAKIIYINLKI